MEDFKEDINKNIVIAGDFNTQLSPMHRYSRQKITKIKNKYYSVIIKNKETATLDDTLYWIDFIAIYRMFQLKATECTHELFSNIDHMVGHKISLNQFKKIQIK